MVHYQQNAPRSPRGYQQRQTDRHMIDETEEEQYRSNKGAMVGQSIICAGPYCNRSFSKKCYQQAFCCLKCKNQYWNKKREQ